MSGSLTRSTPTHIIFPFFAASTPFLASSKTTEFKGSTLISLAAFKNISGSGLPFLNPYPSTTASNVSKTTYLL